jgi:hypothetical protein
LAESIGRRKYKAKNMTAPVPIEMSQCLPVNTGAFLDEESSKVSSNMVYRLLKNYARFGQAAAK